MLDEQIEYLSDFIPKGNEEVGNPVRANQVRELMDHEKKSKLILTTRAKSWRWVEFAVTLPKEN